MSKDKYPSIFSPQMEAIVYIYIYTCMCVYGHMHIRKIHMYNTRMRSSHNSELHCTAKIARCGTVFAYMKYMTYDIIQLAQKMQTINEKFQ